MKKKVLALAVTAMVVLAAVGIAWALWTTSSMIRVALEVSSPPEAAVTSAFCDDDGVVDNAFWDPNDTGPDPASPGPAAIRYDKDISSAVATHAAGEGNLRISAGYAALWSTSWWGIENPPTGQIWTLAGVELDGLSLSDCPSMASADLDGDTNLDVAACVSVMVSGSSAEEEPILGANWAAGESKKVKLALQVLDTVTPGQTFNWDVIFYGTAQTGGS